MHQRRLTGVDEEWRVLILAEAIQACAENEVIQVGQCPIEREDDRLLVGEGFALIIRQ